MADSGNKSVNEFSALTSAGGPAGNQGPFPLAVLVARRGDK
jgi:hypothetical protein